MALLALLTATAPLLASAALCALPSSYKPTLTDACATAPFASPALALLAARGELESGTVLLDAATAAPLQAPTIEWAAGSAPAGVSATVQLLAYVHTEASPRYAGSRAGWFAEALLPWPPQGVAVAPGGNAAAWVTLNVSASAAPGAYSGLVRAGGASLPLTLQVYALALPPLGVSPFRTIYAFDGSILPRAYAGVPGFNASATQRHYWAALAAQRFPATNIYATQPLALAEYAELAALGSNVLILADISALPGSPYQGARRLRSGGGGVAGALGCPTFSPAYIAGMVALLNTTWVGLQGLGLSPGQGHGQAVAASAGQWPKGHDDRPRRRGPRRRSHPQAPRPPWRRCWPSACQRCALSLPPPLSRACASRALTSASRPLPTSAPQVKGASRVKLRSLCSRIKGR